ncbi:type I polyketide synthase [Nocardiopsis composta]
MVLLKRLSDALADGDDVRAVILGSAVNNDGADKVGFTAPSVERQAEVVEQALRNARIDPAGIGYVEAHGTGTALGDPIEIAALTEAFGRVAAAPLPRGGCAVGSVKSNIGHLDEAAGVAGLIKAALAVRHGEIPATLHVRRPNPRIGFEETPFYVNTRLRPWPQGPGPRRAGVSSFGMGGTNCHAVLEEPPAGQAAAGTERRPQIILVSARTPEGLGEAARRHAAHLAGGRAEPLADVAATAATGRRHFEHRAAVVADTPEQARELLLEAARGSAPAAARSTAFLYGGQGSHSTAMGLELYRSLPVFRDALDACAEALRPHLPSPLLPEMFAGGDGTGPGPLEDTAWAQPALFAIGYALTRTWRALGVRPDVVIGHSIGEYAAAEAAGVLTLEDAAALVAARGRLMAALPRGAMVAVEAGPEEVAPLLRGAERHAAVAAVNGERATVLSGERAAVRRIAAELRERGTRCKELAVSHAFHSPMMDPAAERFAEVAEGVGFSAPHTPIVSTVTGGLIGDEIARPDHWVRNVREPVLFSAGLAAVEEFGAEAFVELSARPVLLGLLYGRDGEGKGPRVPSMRAGREREQLLRAAGELHRAGMQIDWSQVYPRGAHRRVALPTYPWRRRRYWIDPPAPAAPDAAPAAPGTHPVLGGRIELPESREARFTSVVGPRRLPWLADHRVFDTLVLPGVAYIEAALSAARAITGEPEQELTDFVIHRAMTFPDEDAERTVQVVAEPDGKGAHRLKILSREGASPDPAREWTLHASAVLARPAAGARPEEAERTPAAAGEELDPEEIYRGERGRGIDLGPRFHATAELRRDGTSCTSRIRLPDSERGDAGRYGVHPVLLEACFLALTVAYPRRHLRRTYVPAGAERIRWSAPIPPDVRCEAHIRPDEDGDAEALRGDVRLVGPDGGTLLSMEGILLKRAERTAMVGGGQPWRKWLYRTVWRPDPLPAGAAAPTGSTGSSSPAPASAPPSPGRPGSAAPGAPWPPRANRPPRPWTGCSPRAAPRAPRPPR